MKRIESMLPFLDSKDIVELVEEILQGNVNMPIEATLPFLDEEDVDTICQKIADNPEFLSKVNLSAFYPFASQEYVDKLFLAAVESGSCDMNAMPFVSDKCLHEFVQKYVENPNPDVDIDVLYPFLSNKDISLLFRAYLKQHKNNT